MRRLRLTSAALGLLLSLSALASAAPAGAAWVWPVSGDVITPYRNGDDPYAAGQHRGIDIAAPTGTAVRAAAGGDVRFAGTAGSSGLTVSIRTSDGYDTSYLHLSALVVRAGARVSAGDRIGAVGTTGTRSATTPHLHFGVRNAGSRHDYHDPLALLPPLHPPAPAPARSAPSPARSPEPMQPLPAVASAPGGARVRAPAPRAAPRPIPRRLPRGVPRLAPARAAEGAASEDAGGPDIGWLLACAGLLLAAAVLGLAEDGRRAPTRRRSGGAAALPFLARASPGRRSRAGRVDGGCRTT